MSTSPDHLADRHLCWLQQFSAAQDPETNRFSLESLSGSPAIDDLGEYIRANYSGEMGVYQLRLAIPNSQPANGVGARIKLVDWQSISYIAIGYTKDGKFHHVKATTPAQGQWFEFAVGHRDIAWGWQNDWQSPEDFQISDIRLYIKGWAGTAATIEVENFYLWREHPNGAPCPDSNLQDHPALMDVLYDYQRKCLRNFEPQARRFLAHGDCPLDGNVNLEWPDDAILPPALAELGTYQYSWHAFHPATMLILLARETGELAPLFGARDLISGWLERSYTRPDLNRKYAWYDHGTAERCLSLICMYHIGQLHSFDARFLKRLRGAIFRHGQLLASEAFYASHQRTRYHNHAWFQDIALLAVSLAFPNWPASPCWANRALARLTDQFDKLIVRENGFAVFVENSIGYHQGIERLVRLAGQLHSIAGRGPEISHVADELSKFSNFFRYPDPERTVSHGDTFRIPNSDQSARKSRLPYEEHHFCVLPKAGYAIAQGNHEERPFMLTMLATSLSSTHKHEDNLSFTLFFDGIEWLIDPSFYSHEYMHPLPAYLRSAVAHNALTIPGTEYSLQPGVASLNGEASDVRFRVFGCHRAVQNFEISRTLEGRLDRLFVEVVDRAARNIADSHQSTGNSEARLMFHCGEDVRAHVVGQSVILRHRASPFRLILQLPEGYVATVLNDSRSGQEIRGVVGHGFLQVSGINTLEITVPVNEPIRWKIEADRNEQHEIDVKRNAQEDRNVAI